MIKPVTLPATRRRLILGLVLVMSVFARTTSASEATVAVAANFLEPANRLVTMASGEHRYTVISGSTGKLYAQLIAGAPFDVFLSADQATPGKLIEQGMAERSSRSTYAVGKLVLWSRNEGRLNGRQENAAALLASGSFRHLAIANPDIAPYGDAARTTLKRLGLWEQLQPRIVMSPNISDVFLQTLSGNADLGLIAASSLTTSAERNLPAGSRWVVPEGLHPPILQDVVLLKRAANNAAALHFLNHLQSAQARKIIEAAGYLVNDPAATTGP